MSVEKKRQAAELAVNPRDTLFPDLSPWSCLTCLDLGFIVAEVWKDGGKTIPCKCRQQEKKHDT